MILNRLAEVLERKGVTVSGLARGACISRGAAHKLYHARNETLSLEVLDKVCGFLELQVGDVLVWMPEGSDARRLEEARQEELRGDLQLLGTLQRLLEIEATELKGALDQASHLIAETIGADKVDAFLYEPPTDTLVSAGASNTVMARRQAEIGLDRLPLANGGRTVEVYRTGSSYVTGCAWKDPEVLPGYIRGLGVQSMAVVPLEVSGKRRGVLQALAGQLDAFTLDELGFLEAAARWVGLVVHRAELVDRLTRDAITRARRAAADDLVTALARDLGDHLSPLRARVDRLRRGARSEGRQSDLEDIEAVAEEVGYLRRTLADLLDLGRLEEHASSLRRESVDLAALAREVAREMPGDGGRIRLHAPEELMVEGDARRICQALRDLVVNAVRATPEGVPVAVEVGLQAGEGGSWAEVSVRAESPGVPLEVGSKSPGLQTLGLYVAGAIAGAHGGTLTIESHPSRSMNFRLWLPAEEA